MYEIVVGRSEKDREKYGLKGSVLLGKHYVKMGRTTSLSNSVYLDVTTSHVVFVCGKRGSGKSYTMGVIAEGMAELPYDVKNNLSVVILDTMGIYWTMKYPNKKDMNLLKDWNTDPKALDVKIFTPVGYYKKAKEDGVPTDFPFSLKPSELSATDWVLSFGLKENEPVAVLIQEVIVKLSEEKDDYYFEDIYELIDKNEYSDASVKADAKNRFHLAEGWGLFSRDGTDILDLVKAGQITVLDVSAYATQTNSWNVKNLVIGLVSEKLFMQRMVRRKYEEFQELHKSQNYFGDDTPTNKYPLVWLVIDEAHEFLPREGKTSATDALVTILREGRQPGISLILASQQPGKIHTDVMTQADILISHRLTAKLDTDALSKLMQSYMRTGLDKYLDNLPREGGAALIVDDNNERIIPLRIRPRITWHGGSSPNAMPQKNDF